jgi:hypothetical protein
MGNGGASGDPMAFDGRRGEPMADGGAATRRMRVWRVAPARAQRYYAQEPLGTADNQGSAVCLGVHVRRSTAAGRPAVHDVVRAGCRRVPVLNISA